MQLFKRRAYARSGLIGNPSDGYNGKTISLSVRNFWAEVVLYEWDDIEIVFSQEDRFRFNSIQELHHDVAMHGYYGGVRLVKATIKKFVEYCERMGLQLHKQNFAIRYSSNIPRQVGMAGSSAIIVATLRCLMDFYQIGIDRRVQPSLALSVESEELGIGAGLQDRVIQVYEGVVAMDFTKGASEKIEGYECGQYKWLDPDCLPPLYVAFRNSLSEPTEVFHNDLRRRFNSGEACVVDAMHQFADLTDEAIEAIHMKDHAKLAQLVNSNFDLRNSFCNLNPGHVEMVERARHAGASAKYSGSGGAIVGTVPDRETFDRLVTEMAAIGCRVIQPQITNRHISTNWEDFEKPKNSESLESDPPQTDADESGDQHHTGSNSFP